MPTVVTQKSRNPILADAWAKFRKAKPEPAAEPAAPKPKKAAAKKPAAKKKAAKK